MKNIHVTALGNALVDIEYLVSDDELQSTGLRKGGMTLASSGEQAGLLVQLAGKEGMMSSGGSAANSLIALANFGGRGAYKSLLGNDAHGSYYAAEFGELGLELYAERTDELPTGTCVVLITPDGERTMQTSLGVNVRFSNQHIDADAIARAEWLYIEGYKFTEENGASAIDEAIFYAKKHDTNIAVTFSDTFIVHGFRDVLTRAAKNAHLIFSNEFEAKAYGETDSLDDALHALRSDIPNVVVTLGDKGSMLHIGGRDYIIKPHATTVVNTNGAGDMFAGAFLYGLTHSMNPEQAGNLASLASSRVVQQHGARLRENHKKLLEIV
ncbi:MAG: adenosine kinase [Candidatus Kapabacteria bacterium]|nr:adenosine kinase [Candidatus Kapabacteria bacterium]